MKTHKAYRHSGIFRYLIAYDYMAGCNNRYTVWILNADDPVTIGRELSLEIIDELVRDYEREAKKLRFYTGSRKDVLKCHEKVINQRRKRLTKR